MTVRRDSAVKLIDGLAGESPASADCPVGTVVISGEGAGDQTVGSPNVNVLDGWTQVWSAPAGGLAKQQVVAQVNRSQALKMHPHQDRRVRIPSLAVLLRLRPALILASRVLPSTPPLSQSVERHFLDGQLGGSRTPVSTCARTRRTRRSIESKHASEGIPVD